MLTGEKSRLGGEAYGASHKEVHTQPRGTPSTGWLGYLVNPSGVCPPFLGVADWSVPVSPTTEQYKYWNVGSGGQPSFHKISVAEESIVMR